MIQKNIHRLLPIAAAVMVISVLGCSQNTEPNIESTVAAQVAETLQAASSQQPRTTPISVTSTVKAQPADSSPTVTPQATATPLPTAPPTSTPTLALLPPTPTQTAVPTAIPTPTALTPQEIFSRSRGSVVQVIADGKFGTGFLISLSFQDDLAYVVTADHVVSESNEIALELSDGTKIDAELSGRAFGRDLALLKTQWFNASPLPIGSIKSTDLGSQVVRIGFGATAELSVATGVVSAITNDTRFGTKLIQTDTAVNPGDSGSPLINASGEVVGITSSKLVGLGIEGVGFAISAEELTATRTRMELGDSICQERDFVDESLRTGTFRHSTHGYEIENVGWQFVQLDGGTAFGEVVSTAELWRGSFVPAIVGIYDPVPKGSYRSAKQFLIDRFEDISGIDNGEQFIGNTTSVCIAGTEGVEATFKVIRVGEAGKDDERTERWVAFIFGGSAYLMYASSWFDKFEVYGPRFDTMLYSIVP